MFGEWNATLREALFQLLESLPNFLGPGGTASSVSVHLSNDTNITSGPDSPQRTHASSWGSSPSAASNFQ